MTEPRKPEVTVSAVQPNVAPIPQQAPMFLVPAPPLYAMGLQGHVENAKRRCRTLRHSLSFIAAVLALGSVIVSVLFSVWLTPSASTTTHVVNNTIVEQHYIAPVCCINGSQGPPGPPGPTFDAETINTLVGLFYDTMNIGLGGFNHTLLQFELADANLSLQVNRTGVALAQTTQLVSQHTLALVYLNQTLFEWIAVTVNHTALLYDSYQWQQVAQQNVSRLQSDFAQLNLTAWLWRQDLTALQTQVVSLNETSLQLITNLSALSTQFFRSNDTLSAQFALLSTTLSLVRTNVSDLQQWRLSLGNVSGALFSLDTAVHSLQQWQTSLQYVGGTLLYLNASVVTLQSEIDTAAATELSHYLDNRVRVQTLDDRVTALESATAPDVAEFLYINNTLLSLQTAIDTETAGRSASIYVINQALTSLTTTVTTNDASFTQSLSELQTSTSTLQSSLTTLQATVQSQSDQQLAINIGVANGITTLTTNLDAAIAKETSDISAVTSSLAAQVSKEAADVITLTQGQTVLQTNIDQLAASTQQKIDGVNGRIDGVQLVLNQVNLSLSLVDTRESQHFTALSVNLSALWLYTEHLDSRESSDYASLSSSVGTLNTDYNQLSGTVGSLVTEYNQISGTVTSLVNEYNQLSGTVVNILNFDNGVAGSITAAINSNNMGYVDPAVQGAKSYALQLFDSVPNYLSNLTTLQANLSLLSAQETADVQRLVDLIGLPLNLSFANCTFNTTTNHTTCLNSTRRYVDVFSAFYAQFVALNLTLQSQDTSLSNAIASADSRLDNVEFTVNLMETGQISPLQSSVTELYGDIATAQAKQAFDETVLAYLFNFLGFPNQTYSDCATITVTWNCSRVNCTAGNCSCNEWTQLPIYLATAGVTNSSALSWRDFSAATAWVSHLYASQYSGYYSSPVNSSVPYRYNTSLFCLNYTAPPTTLTVYAQLSTLSGQLSNLSLATTNQLGVLSANVSTLFNSSVSGLQTQLATLNASLVLDTQALALLQTQQALDAAVFDYLDLTLLAFPNQTYTDCATLNITFNCTLLNCTFNAPNCSVGLPNCTQTCTCLKWTQLPIYLASALRPTVFGWRDLDPTTRWVPHQQASDYSGYYDSPLNASIPYRYNTSVLCVNYTAPDTSSSVYSRLSGLSGQLSNLSLSTTAQLAVLSANVSTLFDSSVAGLQTQLSTLNVTLLQDTQAIATLQSQQALDYAVFDYLDLTLLAFPNETYTDCATLNATLNCSLPNCTTTQNCTGVNCTNCDGSNCTQVANCTGLGSNCTNCTGSVCTPPVTTCVCLQWMQLPIYLPNTVATRPTTFGWRDIDPVTRWVPHQKASDYSGVYFSPVNASIPYNYTNVTYCVSYVAPTTSPSVYSRLSTLSATISANNASLTHWIGAVSTSVTNNYATMLSMNASIWYRLENFDYTGGNSFASISVSGLASLGSLSVSGTSTLSGTVSLSNGNYLTFGANGDAAPSFTTRSAGTKIVLYDQISASSVDYAIGIQPNTFWVSVPTSASQYLFYAGTTSIATLSGTGALTLSAGLTAPSATFSSLLSLANATNTAQVIIADITQGLSLGAYYTGGVGSYAQINSYGNGFNTAGDLYINPAGGAVIMGGSLSVTGATTLAGLTATTGTFSGVLTGAGLAGTTNTHVCGTKALYLGFDRTNDRGELIADDTCNTGQKDIVFNTGGASAMFGGTVRPLYDLGSSLGTSSYRWTDLYVYNGHITTLTVTGTTTLSAGLNATTGTFSGTLGVTGTLSVTGATTLAGLDATTGTFSGLISANGGINTGGNNIEPGTTSTGSLGTSGDYWNALYVTNGQITTLTVTGSGTFSGLISANGGVSGTTGTFSGTVSPSSNGGANLGSTGTRWGTVYAQNLDVSSTLGVSGATTLAGLTATTGTFSSTLKGNIIQPTGSANLPSVGGGTLILAAGYTSPAAGRLIFGDGTGWKLYFSRISSGVTTDMFTFGDDGSLKLSGLTATTGTFSGTVSPSSNGGADLGSSGTRWGTVYAQYLNAASLSTFGGDIVPASNLGGSLGSASNRWNYVYAQYLNVAGSSTFGGDIVPASDLSVNLGSTGSRWNYVYAGYLEIAGLSTFGGDVVPASSLGSNLGSGSNRWNYVYTQSLDVAGNIVPASDLGGDLGSTGDRWNYVYAQNVIQYGIFSATQTTHSNGVYDQRTYTSSKAQNPYLVGMFEEYARYMTGDTTQLSCAACSTCNDETTRRDLGYAAWSAGSSCVVTWTVDLSPFNSILYAGTYMLEYILNWDGYTSDYTISWTFNSYYVSDLRKIRSPRTGCTVTFRDVFVHETQSSSGPDSL